MTTLIHILGSDIPHHNQTVLTFFNDELAPQAVDSPLFWVVSQEKTLSIMYPRLAIQVFESKKALANSVVNAAQVSRQQRFFFHGQFNALLWLALFRGKIKSQQFWWHIWGADLYEESRTLKFRLFYLLRRVSQKRVGRVFATEGDLAYFASRCPTVPGSVLYFPTKIDPALTESSMPSCHDKVITILVGNSGDRSNNHIDALTEVKKQFGEKINVIIPMGYPDNNQHYIDEVEQAAHALFPLNAITLFKTRIDFVTYLTYLRQCDLGYFIFRRQQGVGTLCLLIQMGIPFVISRENTFWRDLTTQQIPVLFQGDELTLALVKEARRQITYCDKASIAFFPPNFIAPWKQVLCEAEGIV